MARPPARSELLDALVELVRLVELGADNAGTLSELEATPTFRRAHELVEPERRARQSGRARG